MNLGKKQPKSDQKATLGKKRPKSDFEKKATIKGLWEKTTKKRPWEKSDHKGTLGKTIKN